MKNNIIEQSINFLGLQVKDKVTRFSGVVTSVSFDLYGCIQVVINPKVDKDGNLKDGKWFDITRLEIIDDVPVMICPNFNFPSLDNYEKGPAEKPVFIKS